MSLKHNVKTTCLALAALFAFSAIAASAAQATGDAPRWTVNGATPTSGNTPFSAASTGSAGGFPGKLEVPGLFTLTNPAKKCTGSGNIAGSAANTSGTVNLVAFKCQEVDIEGLPKCVIEDETETIPGSIRMILLSGSTVWLASTGDKTGITLAAGGSPLMTLMVTDNPINPGCVFAGLTVKVEGSLIGEIETPGTDEFIQELNFPNPPLTETWTNATPRVRAATADGLKVGGKAASFTNTFELYVAFNVIWGVETG
jgi:hypothetical protein